jgi:hypothetical protein
MRLDKTSHNRTRWDLGYEANPYCVCSVCENWSGKMCKLTKEELLDPQYYFCGEFSTLNHIRPFIKENPHKDWSREQIKEFQLKIANELDISVYTTCRKHYNPYEVDNIDISKCYHTQNKLVLFGTGHIMRCMQSDELVYGKYTWEKKHITAKQICVFKNGASKCFSIEEFTKMLDEKTLLSVMTTVDADNTLRLQNKGEL